MCVEPEEGAGGMGSVDLPAAECIEGEGDRVEWVFWAPTAARRGGGQTM